MITRYLQGAAAYSFVRKIPYLWDAKVEDYNLKDSKYVSRPMLVTEKVGIMGLSTALSPWWVWSWMYSDICQLEVKLRGQPLSLYGYEKKPCSMFAHIFN